MQPRRCKVILQKKIIGCYDELAGKENSLLLRFRGFAAVRKIMNDSVEKE